MGIIRERSELRVRKRHNILLFEEKLTRPHLQSPSSRRGWLRVLRQKTTGHHILSSELLRLVQQQRSDDENIRGFDLFLPSFKARVERRAVQKQPAKNPDQKRRRMRNSPSQSLRLYIFIVLTFYLTISKSFR